MNNFKIWVLKNFIFLIWKEIIVLKIWGGLKILEVIHCLNSVLYMNLHCYFSWQPGITTDEIDQAVHKMIIENGAYPSPLGYGGFPKSVCTSVNECICHGIPDSRALEVHFCWNKLLLLRIVLFFVIVSFQLSTCLYLSFCRMVILSILMLLFI